MSQRDNSLAVTCPQHDKSWGWTTRYILTYRYRRYMATGRVQMMWPRGPHEMANKFNCKRHSKHQVQSKERDMKRKGERERKDRCGVGSGSQSSGSHLGCSLRSGPARLYNQFEKLINLHAARRGVWVMCVNWSCLCYICGITLRAHLLDSVLPFNLWK